MTTYALPRRPRLGLFFVTLLAVVLAAPSAQTQTYPSRPVTFVVPFAPGGLSDVPARVLAAEMQDRIGQSIVVENKSGASGVTGATSVWRAEPDGYTLLVNALADVQNLHYIPVPYNAVTDFALIGQITEGPPLVLIVNANLPYKSVAELVADAKANPNKLSFGTSGPATSPVIAVTQLNALAGTKIVDVPYRGSGQAAVAVVTGEVQGAFVFYSNAKPLSDDGKVRALAIASSQRLASWPDIPTMGELGFPGFDHRGFVGLAAPGKTPAPVIAFLNKHLNDTINSASFRGRMEPLGMTIPADNTPEKFAAYMRTRNGSSGGAREALGPRADGAQTLSDWTGSRGSQAARDDMRSVNFGLRSASSSYAIEPANTQREGAMAKINRINPEGISKPFSNYSHVVTAEGAQKLVFCAGQVAADVDGKVLPPDDFDAQAKMVMANLTKALAAGGAKLSDVTKITIYLCNPHDVPKARGLLQTYFEGHPPGSTLCILRGLANPNFLLEIEAIAAV